MATVRQIPRRGKSPASAPWGRDSYREKIVDVDFDFRLLQRQRRSVSAGALARVVMLVVVMLLRRHCDAGGGDSRS